MIDALTKQCGTTPGKFAWLSVLLVLITGILGFSALASKNAIPGYVAIASGVLAVSSAIVPLCSKKFTPYMPVRNQWKYGMTAFLLFLGVAMMLAGGYCIGVSPWGVSSEVGLYSGSILGVVGLIVCAVPMFTRFGNLWNAARNQYEYEDKKAKAEAAKVGAPAGTQGQVITDTTQGKVPDIDLTVPQVLENASSRSDHDVGRHQARRGSERRLAEDDVDTSMLFFVVITFLTLVLGIYLCDAYRSRRNWLTKRKALRELLVIL